MPAPVPIQIRYGDNGVIGAAAAAAGSGQAWQRQKQMDMQLISQMLQNKVQASLQEDQQAHEDQLSNDAFAMQRANQQAQPQQTYYDNANPSGDPAYAQKKMTMDRLIAAGVSGPNLAVMQGGLSNKNINSAYYETMADEIKKADEKQKHEDREIAEKNAFVKSLTPERQKLLEPLAAAHDISSTQLRLANVEEDRKGESEQKQAALMQKAMAASEVQGIQDQINFEQQRLAHMQSTFEKDHKGVALDNPAAGTPEYADPNQAKFTSTYKPWTNIGESFFNTGGATDPLTHKPIAGGRLVGGGDPMGLQARVEIERQKRKIASLENARQQKISSMGIVPTASQPANVSEMSTEDLQRMAGL